jgi:hypothetical protein
MVLGVISEEIRNCLIASNISYFGLKSQFKSQLLSRKTKILIYKTPVRPILTYAMETDDKKLRKKTEYFQKETPLQDIWSNMGGTAVAEEIQERTRRTLQ